MKLHWHEDALASIEGWRRKQPDLPPRGAGAPGVRGTNQIYGRFLL
jgi:hypothetical protein